MSGTIVTESASALERSCAIQIARRAVARSPLFGAPVPSAANARRRARTSRVSVGERNIGGRATTIGIAKPQSGLERSCADQVLGVMPKVFLKCRVKWL